MCFVEKWIIFILFAQIYSFLFNYIIVLHIFILLILSTILNKSDGALI